MSKRLTFIACGALLAIAAVSILLARPSLLRSGPDTTAPGAAPYTAQLSIQPALVQTTPGVTFDVDVVIATVADLGAFEFELTFNPAVVTVTSVQLGPWLGSSGRPAYALGPHIENGAGRVAFGGYTLGAAPPGPDGGGVLATLTLHAEAPGASGLDFDHNLLTDHAALVLTTSTTPGQVVVQSATPTPTPTPALTATPTPTATETATPAPTNTPTNTATHTPTPTRTPTRTPKPTKTRTPTPTGIAGTPTFTPTSGPSPTPTRTPTFGPSPTPTRTPTRTPKPTKTHTPTATPTRTPTAGPSPTPTPTPPVFDTGFLSPTANQVMTGGDGNGFEVNPAQAYSDDGLFAADFNSGTGASTSCTSPRKDRHAYASYSITLPGGAVVQGIEVRLDGKADSVTGAPFFCVQLSADGGVTWTTGKASAPLGTSEATYLLGGSSDAWGRTWSASQLSNASFRVLITSVASITDRDFSLDYAAVKVYYH